MVTESDVAGHFESYKARILTLYVRTASMCSSNVDYTLFEENYVAALDDLEKRRSNKITDLSLPILKKIKAMHALAHQLNCNFGTLLEGASPLAPPSPRRT